MNLILKENNSIETTIVLGYQFDFDREEMLADTANRVFLNDKFLGNNLTRELLDSVNRVYGFIGPLSLEVVQRGKLIKEILFGCSRPKF